LDPAMRVLGGMFGWNRPGEGESLSSINSPVAFVWLGILALIAWLMPNGLEILNRHQPAHEINQEADAPLPRWQELMRWQPTRIWAVGMALALAYCILSLSQVSEFLYFQF